MRVLRFLPLVFLLSLPLFAQQTTTTAAPAPQDVQAVSVLTQAVTLAGGTTAITAITDYTGLGNITYHLNPDVQGTVTIEGLQHIDFRANAMLPTGVRSWAIHDGILTVKHEDGTLWSATNPPNVPSSDAFPYQTPLFPGSLAFPYRQLVTVLGSPTFSIAYNGITQVDGHSVHDIQVQRVSPSGVDPMSQYHAREFFIDTTTFQIVMAQDYIPKNVLHQIHYSNYAAVSGVLVPFGITEDLGGQATWSIQLSQMTFNSGLQDSAFALQ